MRSAVDAIGVYAVHDVGKSVERTFPGAWRTVEETETRTISQAITCFELLK